MFCAEGAVGDACELGDGGDAPVGGLAVAAQSEGFDLYMGRKRGRGQGLVDSQWGRGVGKGGLGKDKYLREKDGIAGLGGLC